MKNELNRAEFLAALKIAAPALGGDDSVMPALSNFCFEGDSFYAYNDIVAVVVGYPTGLNLGLHGPTLLGLLGSSRSKEIDVTVKGQVAHITGAGKLELPVLDKADFVFSIPDEQPILSAPLTADVRHALEVCLISVAEDSLRLEFNGVTLRIGRTGTLLFSTDNSTATRMSPGGTKVPSRKEAAMVLPKVAVDLILKLSPKEGLPKMHVGEKVAIVEFGGAPDVTLITKLLGEPSMRLDEVFKDHADGGVSFPIPEGFADEIEKARVLTTREQIKECRLLFSESGQLIVSCSTSLGKMSTLLKVADKKSEGVVTINPDHVARVLPHASGMHFNPGRSLVLVGEGMSHIISALPQAQKAESPPAGAKESVEDDIPF